MVNMYLECVLFVFFNFSLLEARNAQKTISRIVYWSFCFKQARVHQEKFHWCAENV